MALPIKNISGFPIDVREDPHALARPSFRSVNVDLACDFPYSELAKLCRMIEAALPNKQHRVVQFMSAYKDEGASEIALETAITAARLIGQRVLFIDTATASADHRKRKLPDSFAALETLLLTGGSPYEAIAQVAGTELYLAMLCSYGEDGLAPIPLNAIENALEKLRFNFDLIIIDSQAILSDAFGMALTKLADGSVMVIEAERTRAPVAIECKRLLKESGGRLLGAVMNRRRLYIPPMLYRLLYQRIAL